MKMEKLHKDAFLSNCFNFAEKVFPAYKQSIFHYCNIDTLKKIIENESILLVNINYLNDLTEFNYGFSKVFDEYIKKVKATISDTAIHILLDNAENSLLKKNEILDVFLKSNKATKYYLDFFNAEFYTKSFSKKGDLLNQWKFYANQAGVSIEFDFSDFILGCEIKSEISPILLAEGLKPREVIYDINKMKTSINSQINLLTNDFDSKPDNPPKIFEDLAKIAYCATFYKNDYFNNEEEIRISFCPAQLFSEKMANYEKSLLYVINDKGIMRPTIILKWHSGKKTTPVKSFTVGPGVYQEIVYKGLIHYFNNYHKKIFCAKKHNDTNPDCKGPPCDPTCSAQCCITASGIIVRKSKIPYVEN